MDEETPRMSVMQLHRWRCRRCGWGFVLSISHNESRPKIHTDLALISCPLCVCVSVAQEFEIDFVCQPVANIRRSWDGELWMGIMLLVLEMEL